MPKDQPIRIDMTRADVAEHIREPELPEALPQVPIRFPNELPKADEPKIHHPNTPSLAGAASMSDDSNATQHYDNQESVLIQIDNEAAAHSTPARPIDEPMKLQRRRS